jgi:hypothetical protein
VSWRFALWVAIGALLLKSAVPMLAAAAANMRGVAVAEVCAIYGVALPPMHEHHAGHAHQHTDSGHGDHGSHSAAEHTDRCALTALAALALQDPVAPTIAHLPAAVSRVVSSRRVQCRDASATWMARLKHGPPPLA